jgi:hypothetical protein
MQNMKKKKTMIVSIGFPEKHIRMFCLGYLPVIA